MAAAARGRVSVHRSRPDRRLVGFRFSARVREVARRACDARACTACTTTSSLRAYVHACMRPRAIRNRVARCTDSTSSIGAPNAEEEEEEAEDRIDSPVTQTRDRATTSLTSASSKNPVGPPRDAAREK